ncbi:MAG: hypothetical protein U0L97_04530 [Candidatus Saccharimonadaceae bacterium]|nr:hypothetical protein [Candidatus Saccharimonadaceae bacterium]
MNTSTGFYLLSPCNRNSNRETYHFYLEPQSGRLSILYTNGIGSIRPVISLNSGITASAGSGIATDPWVVTTQ